MHFYLFLNLFFLASHAKSKSQISFDNNDTDLPSNDLKYAYANVNEKSSFYANVDEKPSLYVSDDTLEIAKVQTSPVRDAGIIIDVPPDALPTEGICPAPDATRRPKVPQRYLACCVIFSYRRKLHKSDGEGMGTNCFWLTEKNSVCDPRNVHCCKDLINPTPEKDYSTIADECVDPFTFYSSHGIPHPQSVHNSGPSGQRACPVPLQGSKYKREDCGSESEN